MIMLNTIYVLFLFLAQTSDAQCNAGEVYYFKECIPTAHWWKDFEWADSKISDKVFHVKNQRAYDQMEKGHDNGDTMSPVKYVADALIKNFGDKWNLVLVTPFDDMAARKGGHRSATFVSYGSPPSTKLQGVVRIPGNYWNGNGPFLHEIGHNWNVHYQQDLRPEAAASCGSHWGMTGMDVWGQLGGFRKDHIYCKSPEGQLVDINKPCNTNELIFVNERKNEMGKGSPSTHYDGNSKNTYPYSKFELFNMGLISEQEMGDEWMVYCDVKCPSNTNNDIEFKGMRWVGYGYEGQNFDAKAYGISDFEQYEGEINPVLDAYIASCKNVKYLTAVDLRDKLSSHTKIKQLQKGATLTMAWVVVYPDSQPLPQMLQQERKVCENSCKDLPNLWWVAYSNSGCNDRYQCPEGTDCAHCGERTIKTDMQDIPRKVGYYAEELETYFANATYNKANLQISVGLADERVVPDFQCQSDNDCSGNDYCDMEWGTWGRCLKEIDISKIHKSCFVKAEGGTFVIATSNGSLQYFYQLMNDLANGHWEPQKRTHNGEMVWARDIESTFYTDKILTKGVTKFYIFMGDSGRWEGAEEIDSKSHMYCSNNAENVYDCKWARNYENGNVDGNRYQDAPNGTDMPDAKFYYADSCGDLDIGRVCGGMTGGKWNAVALNAQWGGQATYEADTKYGGSTYKIYWWHGQWVVGYAQGSYLFVCMNGKGKPILECKKWGTWQNVAQDWKFELCDNDEVPDLNNLPAPTPLPSKKPAVPTPPTDLPTPAPIKKVSTLSPTDELTSAPSSAPGGGIPDFEGSYSNLKDYCNQGEVQCTGCGLWKKNKCKVPGKAKKFKCKKVKDMDLCDSICSPGSKQKGKNVRCTGTLLME